ncbi:MAG: hypothetical protein FWH16_02615 [Oscillospiraceae bacterium]|nr:hypothetical protein [Oscillospiraceae bacterium]
MQAIQGVYDNGKFSLERQAPVKRSRIIVLFSEEEAGREARMSNDEALRILDKYKGSIKGDFDAESERDEYLNEKFGFVD